MNINALRMQLALEDMDRKDYLEAAIRLYGFASGVEMTNPETAGQLRVMAAMLKRAGEHMCAQGYFGCHGGERCTSDHK
jgi:NADH:ubiquinone oxidoreductase subunit D